MPNNNETTKNAIINDVSLFIEEHGFLTANLLLSYGDGMMQNFGGICLFNSSFPSSSHAGFFIYKCLEIAGVESWDDLVGKSIRVIASLDKVFSIGHITKDIWFTPYTDLK